MNTRESEHWMKTLSKTMLGNSPSLMLEHGSRVAVIGGGPAGSFFSYFLLGMAERAGIKFEHVRSARDDEHPVTGHLPRLSVPEEMVQVLDAIAHLRTTDASPAERAAVYERKAALLDRIAAEDDHPEATEQAAEARARAAELRSQTTTTEETA